MSTSRRAISLSVFCVLLGMGAAATAHAYAIASLRATCEGDSVVVRLTVINGDELAPGTSIAVRATLNGSCDDEELLPAAPIPVLSVAEDQEFTFTTRPSDPGRCYVYRAMFVDETGQLSPAPAPWCESARLPVSCRADGAPLVLRGTYFALPGEIPRVIACAGQCWMVDDELFYDAEPFAVLGGAMSALVNVYGSIIPVTPCSLPGSTAIRAERVELIDDPDGCDAVDDTSVSWGSLKAMYH